MQRVFGRDDETGLGFLELLWQQSGLEYGEVDRHHPGAPSVVLQVQGTPRFKCSRFKAEAGQAGLRAA